MDLTQAMTWAAARKHGVLITLRSDGRAQSSDIVYTVEGNDFLVSVTETRAKTHNMARDSRVVMHLTDPDSWSYLSFDATVALSEPTTSSDDATSDLLVTYYEAVAGEAHPNWSEYRHAMVKEGRLVARLTPGSVVGQIN